MSPSVPVLGLTVVALGALCHHNSRSVGLPEAFFASTRSRVNEQRTAESYDTRRFQTNRHQNGLVVLQSLNVPIEVSSHLTQVSATRYGQFSSGTKSIVTRKSNRRKGVTL